MREAFHVFSTKNIGIFEILTFEILTSRKLMMLVLNNRAQNYERLIMKGCVDWNPIYGGKDICLQEVLNPDCYDKFNNTYILRFY